MTQVETVYTVADKDGFATAGPMTLEQAKQHLAMHDRLYPAKQRFIWQCTLDAERHLTPVKLMR